MSTIRRVARLLRRSKRTVLLLAAASLGGVGCSGASTDEVEAALAAFEAPGDWIAAETVVRGTGCFDVDCPLATTRWEVPAPPSPAELEQLLTDAGWEDVTVEGDCTPEPSATGPFPVCEAAGDAGGHPVRVGVSGPVDTGANPFWVTVTVSS